MFYYAQKVGGNETWSPVPAAQLAGYIQKHEPMFVTVLAVNKLVEDLLPEERDKLSYEGPFYVDWDGSSIATVLPKVHAFMDKLETDYKLNLDSARWYITGSKGFHCEIPAQCFLEKQPKGGTPNLPYIYKEMVFEMYVDTIDLKVYSQARGRQWRQPNVRRENGNYKVQVTAAELRAMTEESYFALCKSPRELFATAEPELTTDLSVTFARAQQKVTGLMKARKSRKRDPLAKDRAACTSIKMMMSNIGVKDGVGFHPLALQISIAATTAGQTEEEMLADCAILIDSHQGDGIRYNTPGKRREELIRMYRYMQDNGMYDFSIGAIKALLTHKAPDLDGIPANEDDIKELVEEAADIAPKDATDKTPDEYHDVAGGVELSKFGVYVPEETGGKRRICAVSFQDIHLLMSADNGQMVAYEAQVLVNGRSTGRITMEMEVFQSIQMFNRFCQRFGHQMQGTESHLRGLFMRFIELAKKKGRLLYIAKREGLDIFNIPNHEDPELREPFLVWADGRGVQLDPRVQGKDLNISFQGFPDPRGLFRTDLADAPKLIEWIDEPGNKDALRETLQNMFTCQKPDVISKLVGWYTACFYRMPFHRAYGKFPLLHVNGAAGAGKCLARGTPVIMADGSIRSVEDIAVGDTLLGPDGQPRKVTSLGRGRDTMYKVCQNKGMTYVVNSEHNLSLVFSDNRPRGLADGRKVLPGETVKINVKTFCESPASTQKALKGWKPGAVEFGRPQVKLLLDPYCLGAWLGDGKSDTSGLCKPYCGMVQRWTEYAMTLGCTVKNVNDPKWNCGVWLASGDCKGNPMMDALRHYDLIDNKHIPDAYLYSPKESRLALLAGLIDSDGNVNNAGYRFSTAKFELAESVAFLSRSLGFRAQVSTDTRWHEQQQAMRTIHLVFITGDVGRIPTIDKKAVKRAARDNWLLTGITVEKLDEGDYFGFEIDGDHQFLLGDFTVTFNTEMNKAMAHLFFYNQEPKTLTPQSTPFAIQQHLSGSVSIPLILDEYKPHEMTIDLHNKLKLLFRDAYNLRDIMKGGGNRENDDYRSLSHTQLAAPMVFIAEAAEEEAAVAERVVLLTVVKPASSVSLKWLARFQAWERNKKHLAIIGKYLASEAINTVTVKGLQEDFDVIFEEARNKYMLTEADLSRGLDEKTLSEKQGAKERSVFNFTVARYGLLRFKRVVDAVFGPAEFAAIFKDLEDAIYTRMSDLQPATQAEWAKVLDSFATMSYAVDADSQWALRSGTEYALGSHNGRNVVEVSMVACYLKYRAYYRSTGSKPLFSGVQSFMHSIKDSSALIEHGHGRELDQPGVFIFDVDELAKLKVGQFKG